MKKMIALCLFVLLVSVNPLFANDDVNSNIEKKVLEKEKTTLDEMVVKAKKESRISNKMIFTEELKNKITVKDSKNVWNLLNDISMIDSRQQSDLGPTGQRGEDGCYLFRGFGSRYTMAINGIQQHRSLCYGGCGGGTNIFFLPPWLIESVEIIPGPHSALYPGKSMGGVINFKTSTPKVYDTLKPDIGFSTSYSSYNSQNYNSDFRGSFNRLTYDAGLQYLSTDGYLRNNSSSLYNLSGRIGYVFENDGYITFNIGHSQSDYELPIKNYGGIEADSTAATFDSSYPTVTGSSYYDWQDPEREESYLRYAVDTQYPTSFGTISGGAYYTKDTREELQFMETTDTEKSSRYAPSDSHTYGFRIQDEIIINENHKTILAYDGIQKYMKSPMSYPGWDDRKRVETHGGALEHEWKLIPSLALTLGVRYEHTKVWMMNYMPEPVAGYGLVIPKTYDGIAPKFVLHYDMNNIAPWLRDTSLMFGASRIWHAPDEMYNWQRRPIAIHTDPEEGMAYDLIFMRRLFNNFHMNLGYSYMHIKNFQVWNKNFSEYQPVESVDQSLWYKDFNLNCEAMDRHGVEIGFRGDITDDLNMSLGYSYQHFINQGDEPAGEEYASDRAKHKVKAALQYQIIPNLFFNSEYIYQSRQVEVNEEEVAPDVFVERRVEIDPYNLVNAGFSYTFKDKRYGLQGLTAKIYCNNVFNEEYENSKGYPSTDRTFGVALSLKI